MDGRQTACRTSCIEKCFPNSEIYLCDFHCLQAWECIFKTSKFGLSADKEGMALLRSIVDSCTQEEFKDNLRKLKSSHVWNKSRSTLPAYFKREWTGNEEVNELNTVSFYEIIVMNYNYYV